MTHLDKFEQDLARNKAERDRNDLSKILSLAEGRRLVWSMLSAAGVYGRSFTGEPLTTAHNEGRREGGIQLLERIEEQAPGSYLVMLREALDEETLIKNGRKIAEEQDASEAE